MNRYDWLILAFRIVVSSDAINEARALIAELESATIDKSRKREIVEKLLLPSIKAGGVYVARALIKLLLESIRSKP